MTGLIERREELLASIAETTVDYREGDLDPPTPSHVDRWVRQFGEEVQLPILEEMDHVLKQTYFSKRSYINFFSDLIDNKLLTRNDPRKFWSNAHYLDIQLNGHSQRDIRSIFGALMSEKLGLGIDECGKAGGVYIYLDDVIFTGDRVLNDLTVWIKEEAPDNAVVFIMMIAAYEYSGYKSRSDGASEYRRNKLEELANNVGKKIEFRLGPTKWLENRWYQRDRSEVLWPAALPDDPGLQGYLQWLESEEKKKDKKTDYPIFTPRQPTHGSRHNKIFSSEEGRQLLERELLLAGVRIHGFSKEPSPSLRPLGYGRFNMGFGSTIVTYRNCPNNAPLALWWGDSQVDADQTLGKWYPLFPRKPYEKP